MIPLEIITQVARAVREIFAFLQTPAGQKVVEKSLSDQEAARKWFEEVRRWLETRVKVD